MPNCSTVPAASGNPNMTSEEQELIDKELAGKLEWAEKRSDEAEQLALDASRLLACTTDNVKSLESQGFFRRCKSAFSRERSSVQSVNINNLAQMQKYAWRYLELLQERQLMLAHSVLVLKNNLLSLSVREVENRELVARLAQNTLRRFTELEGRIDRLEVSVNLQGWILTLPQSDYETRYPEPCLRLLHLVNDFYAHKPNDWNCQDLLFMKTALNSVHIDPKEQCSLQEFIDALLSEVLKIGTQPFLSEIEANEPKQLGKKCGDFVLNNVSSQIAAVFASFQKNVTEENPALKALSLRRPALRCNALRTVINEALDRLNVDRSVVMTKADIAIEFLNSMRLTQELCTGATAPEALCEKGDFYDKAGDFHSALAYYRRAASAGSGDAMFAIGDYYRLGQGGVKSDLALAAEWFLKAENQDHRSPKLLCRLGELYEQGVAVERDRNKAFSLYQEAANAGLSEGSFLLGNLYSLGRGVERDLEQAFALYLQAAEQGEAHAQNSLGVCYERGRGTQQDLEKAYLWYSRAALQKHSKAAENVCRLRVSGKLSNETVDRIESELIRAAEA